MRSSIVVAVQAADAAARDALALAVDLARFDGASLVVAGVWASPLGAGDALYASAVREPLEHDLRTLRDAVPADVFARTVTRGAYSLAHAVHRISEDEHARLLVLSEGLAGRALHDAPCAAITAPAGWSRRARHGLDVTLAYNDAPESRDALEAAVDLTRRTGGTLRIVHALEPPSPALEGLFVDGSAIPAWTEAIHSTGQAQLGEAERLVADRVPVRASLADGPAWRVVLDAAGDASYVVTGSRRFGGLRRLLLGSTSAALVEHAEVPVLVVPRGASPVPAPDPLRQAA